MIKYKELMESILFFITCKRCNKKRDILLFWDKNNRRKLCVICRNYNQNYLKNLLIPQDQELIICNRCHKPRDIMSFWDSNNRRKLCLECRNYNKQYLNRN
jgi:hypothetical protein